MYAISYTALLHMTIDMSICTVILRTSTVHYCHVVLLSVYIYIVGSVCKLWTFCVWQIWSKGWRLYIVQWDTCRPV